MLLELLKLGALISTYKTKETDNRSTFCFYRSGKTVAFGVPAIQHILSLPPLAKKAKGPVSVLVVAPTRELAMQTHSNLSLISSSMPNLTSLCIYGGVSKDDQKKVLRTGPRIVVGTPGRLLDLAREGALDLSHVSWLVLDEADRMLDKGFENDIREIIKLCLPLPTSQLSPIGAAGTAETPVSRRVRGFYFSWRTMGTDHIVLCLDMYVQCHMAGLSS